MKNNRSVPLGVRCRRTIVSSLSLLAGAGLFPATSHAGDSTADPITGDSVTTGLPEAVEEESFYDRLWGYATLYENKDNPVVQKLSIVGRAQADAAYFEGSGGGEKYDDVVWRRFRVGLKAAVLGDLTVHAEADWDLNEFDLDELDDTYNRLTETYVAWSPNDEFSLKLGKQSAGFTLDGATSSKKLITLERSTVATNLWFPNEYFTGALVSGTVDGWRYKLGGFSASGDDEFGDFDSGYFGLASIGRDVSAATGLDGSDLRLDYVYNDPDYSGNVGTRDLRHVLSLSGQFEDGNFGLWSDVAFGQGIADQGDVFGLQVMPYYNFSDEIQAVFRYTYVKSQDDNGVRLNRYESRVVSGAGDEAHEFFLGLNWYIYGHKLKWQNGIEYIHASDSAGDGGAYDGWGFTSGIRLSW